MAQVPHENKLRPSVHPSGATILRQGIVEVESFLSLMYPIYIVERGPPGAYTRLFPLQKTADVRYKLMLVDRLYSQNVWPQKRGR